MLYNTCMTMKTEVKMDIVNVSIPHDLKLIAQEYSKENDFSFSRLVRESLRKYLLANGEDIKKTKKRK